MEAIAIARRFETIATRAEAIALRLEAIKESSVQKRRDAKSLAEMFPKGNDSTWERKDS